MLIEVDSTVYKLYFRRNTRVKKHVIESGPGYSLVLNRREITTIAVLEEKSSDGSTMIYEGKAVCGILDVFNKETGRVLAMKDAMKEIPRDTREIIWDRYHGRKSEKTVNSSMFSLLQRIEEHLGLEKNILTSNIISTENDTVV